MFTFTHFFCWRYSFMGLFAWFTDNLCFGIRYIACYQGRSAIKTYLTCYQQPLQTLSFSFVFQFCTFNGINFKTFKDAAVKKKTKRHKSIIFAEKNIANVIRCKINNFFLVLKWNFMFPFRLIFDFFCLMNELWAGVENFPFVSYFSNIIIFKELERFSVLVNVWISEKFFVQKWTLKRWRLKLIMID